MADRGSLLERGESPQGGHSIVVKAIAVVTVLVVMTTFLGVFIYGGVNQSLLNRLKGSHDIAPLPKSFVLPRTSMTPVKDQMSRGTCWIFSTIGLLESSYRKWGYQNHFLAENEYVPFSEQAYGIGMVRYCLQHKEDPFCFGGPPENTPDDGEPEWLYYMNEKITTYVMPEGVCPYSPKHDNELKCDGIDEAKDKNPIKLKIKSLQSAYTIDAIKRLLYEKQVALAWSHAIYSTTYVVPCNDPRNTVAHTEQCTKCFHPCASGCCAEIQMSGYTNQGVFNLHNYPHIGGGHAMLVVGWNDDFRVDYGLPSDLKSHTMGGLIIKNSWSYSRGHSAGYWAQHHSIMDENFICPCEKSSATWLPVNRTCMAEHKDPRACAPEAKKVVRKTWLRGATVLQCSFKALNNTATANFLGWNSCQQGMYYALAAAPWNSNEVWVTTPAESDGYVRFHLVGWDPSNETSPVVEIETNDTTWGGLEVLLTPVTVYGNTNQCGYYFVPYDVFTESTARFPAGGHDTPSVSYIEVEWDEKSYVKARAGSKDYTLLINSTRYFLPTKFTGPFDWQASTGK